MSRVAAVVAGSIAVGGLVLAGLVRYAMIGTLLTKWSRSPRGYQPQHSHRNVEYRDQS